MTLPRFIPIALMWWLLAPAGVALAAESNDDITVRVETRGKTVIVDVELPIGVSPEEAWPTLVDYDHMADFLPNLQESRILTKHGNRLRVVQKGRASRGLISFAFENVRDVALQPPHQIRTELVSGTLKAAESLTRVERTDGGARLINHGEYTVGDLVPVSLATDSIVAETREQFARIRAEIMRRHSRVASVP
ncbi:MAG: SRPBCC family protein [Pseudomonadota bacterium]|nr:SRPBCC family protein [Pseudomonadota bacterium]